jgi:hypothetical protein
MSGPLDEGPSGDDSGATYEASQPQGDGHDASSQPMPGQDASSTMQGDDDGSTGGGEDSAAPISEAASDAGSSSDTSSSAPEDATGKQQDSSSSGQDAMGPPDTGPPTNCADPSTPAACHACSPGLSCQPNGCYNGYICNTLTNRCRAPGTCS